jgi:excisionase family DNA binding protein
MSEVPEMLTVAQAAHELGLSPVSIRRAVMRKALKVMRLDGRTYLVSREEVERYRRERLGNPGGRKRPDEALTEQQRKQRAYQQAYYQRRKAARQQQQQPAAEPEE